MTPALLPPATLDRGGQSVPVEAIDIRWRLGGWTAGRVWLPPLAEARSLRPGDPLGLKFAGRLVPLVVRRVSASVNGVGAVTLDLIDPLEGSGLMSVGLAGTSDMTLADVLERLASEHVTLSGSASSWRTRGVWCGGISAAAAVGGIARAAGAEFWRDGTGTLHAGSTGGIELGLAPAALRQIDGDRWVARVTAGAVPGLGDTVTADGRGGTVRAVRLIDDGRSRSVRISFGAERITPPALWRRHAFVAGTVVDPEDPLVEVPLPGGTAQPVLGRLLEPHLAAARVELPLAAGDPVMVLLPRGVHVGSLPVLPLAPGGRGNRPDGVVAEMQAFAAEVRGAVRVDAGGSVDVFGEGIGLNPGAGFVEIP